MSERKSFEEILDEYGELTYTNRGTSMMPMLREKKDLFTVKKKTEERCRENDVVLYKRNGQYILHRIIEVLDDGYVILGDNCIAKEYDIKDENILGVLTSFQRDGKLITVTDPEYLRYVAKIRRTQSARIFLKRVKGKIRRMLK